jgi:LPS sulfotransferase NodH
VRSRCPVFIVGCHRSGTNLLYDMLLSAGGFAVYRGYLPVYKMLIPRVGKLNKPGNRAKLLEIWLRSKGFRRSGLDAAALTEKVQQECRTGGDFIRITMDEIARQQNAVRWAVYDPDNVLHLPKIKADIPQALFLHIIRDGRDIALSLKKMGGFQPLPWDRGSRSLLATAMYWEWMVRRGQRYGQMFPTDYIEVHYEELVSQPQAVLRRIGEFLEHDLDYDRIQTTSLGRLQESNSSFRGEQDSGAQSSPVNRWKERLSRQEVAALEALVGKCLEDLGYELMTTAGERKPGPGDTWMQFEYPTFLSTKLWLKTETPLGHFASLSELELSEEAAQAGSTT